jgi:glycosyltransferase involved in cell wall biosynthesis
LPFLRPAGILDGMKPTRSCQSTDHQIWIVIAALNESGRVGKAVRELVTRGWQVVVVNDGSTDSTATEARDAGAHVLTHLVNRGQGAALQTGIEFCLLQDCDVVVTFDADGQHHVADIDKLIDPILTNEADVVLGSRFLGHTAGMPRHRRWLLKAAVWFTRLTTGLDVTDTHNGIRALAPNAARRIEITEDRMAHASDLLHQIASLKLRYVESPVTITYTADTLAKGQQNSAVVGIFTRLIVSRILP